MGLYKLSFIFIIGFLEGCATTALKLAPDAPDRPWQPATDVMGEILPGKKGLTANAKKSTYVLPKNKRISLVQPNLSIDEKKVYTLPELIDIAESNNPQTMIAWTAARKAALTVGITESAYLPQLSASVLGVSAPPQIGSISTLTLQWLLFDFGKRSALLDAAEQASIISNISFNAVHQQIIHDVALAFYMVIAAEETCHVAEETQKNAQAVQVAAEQRFKHGVGTIVDVAQARQRTAQADYNVVSTKGNSENAYIGLISAMGISPLSKIKIADLPEHELDPKLNEPIEHIIADALSRRPDVLNAYAMQKASLAKVRSANAEFLPQLFLSASGSYNENQLNVHTLPSNGQQGLPTSVNPVSLGGTIFFGVNMPLYDGGTRAAKVAQAEADAKSAEAQTTKVKIEAIRQIVVAENTLKTSLAEHKSSEIFLETAQIAYDSALAAYQNGTGSITDVSLADNQLMQAKNTMTNAYSSSLSAAASLALATGDLVEPP